MNRTTALFGIVAGLAGAGITYGLKSKDTIWNESALKISKENSSVLSQSLRISPEFKNKYENVIKKCREYVKTFKDEIGTPGVVVGVSIDGNVMWEEGFGYANIETSTPCLPDTAMRIASISKPITMTLLAKLHDTKNISFDASIHDHVPYFPKKKIDGEEVDITIRQLASHTSGVRHYKRKEDESEDPRREFYIKDKFTNIENSVELFKSDELFFKPGTSYLYTTHGYTLLSAVIENFGKKPFTDQIQNLFKTLGLDHTHLDRVDKIIYGRANYYNKNERGHIINAELADVSYKWAGGGLMSTVGDLLKFANVMLYSYQQTENHKPGYLNKKTVQEMWTPVHHNVVNDSIISGFGLGWYVTFKLNEIGGLNEQQKFQVGHKGSAVGASSLLVIYPKEMHMNQDENNKIVPKLPQGIAIAILVNLESTSCEMLSKRIAHEFLKEYNL